MTRSINIVAAAGTSLTAQNYIGSSAGYLRSAAVGPLTWLRALYGDSMPHGQWYDPSNLTGRYALGANMGESGSQTPAIEVWLDDYILDKYSNVGLLILEGGTNDFATRTGDEVASNLIRMAKKALALDIKVVMVSVAQRDSSIWAADGEIRQKAMRANHLVRQFCLGEADTLFFDVDRIVQDWDENDPITDYTHDGTHWSVLGAYKIAVAMKTAITDRFGLSDEGGYVGGVDDLYNADFNRHGSILNSVDLSGTGGTAGAGVTGNLPTGFDLARNSGGATCATTIAERSDQRGNELQLVFTPDGSGTSAFTLDVPSSISNDFVAGEWVDGGVYFDISGEGVREVRCYLRDFSTDGIYVEAMENNYTINLPDGCAGWAITPPMQKAGTGNLFWRVQIEIDDSVAGDKTVTLSHPRAGLTRNPKDLIGYKG